MKKMDDYRDKCEKPIPIGKQEFAYQCEDVALHPVVDQIEITGWIPSRNGKHPYPNSEKDEIDYYRLKIGRFTQNAIEVTLTKRRKDGSEVIYTTTMSFSDLANRCFEGFGANAWERGPSWSYIKPVEK